MDFIEPCFGIGHNLSLICQMTSEDIKHQLIIIIMLWGLWAHGQCCVRASLCRGQHCRTCSGVYGPVSRGRRADQGHAPTFGDRCYMRFKFHSQILAFPAFPFQRASSGCGFHWAKPLSFVLYSHRRWWSAPFDSSANSSFIQQARWCMTFCGFRCRGRGVPRSTAWYW